MSNPDPWPACIFCGQPVDPVAGNWCGHKQMPHSECSWAADEAFWRAWDAEEEEDDAS